MSQENCCQLYYHDRIVVNCIVATELLSTVLSQCVSLGSELRRNLNKLEEKLSPQNSVQVRNKLINSANYQLIFPLTVQNGSNLLQADLYSAGLF